MPNIVRMHVASSEGISDGLAEYFNSVLLSGVIYINTYFNSMLLSSVLGNMSGVCD